MMMHPDDWEKLYLIVRLFLVVGALIYATRCGVALYHITYSF